MGKVYLLLSYGFFIWLLFPAETAAQAKIPTSLSKQTQACIECHVTETKAIYQEWGTRSEERRVGKECRSRWSP